MFININNYKADPSFLLDMRDNLIYDIINRPFDPIALHRLLKHGSKAGILKMPQHRVHLLQVYENGDTVYHVVLRNKKLKEEDITSIFQMFLDRRVYPATLNNYSKAPLYLAIEYRMKYVVNFLIQHSPRLLDSPYVLTRFFIDEENVKFWRAAKQICGHSKFWNSEEVENASANFLKWLVLKELDPNSKYDRDIRLELLKSSIETNLQHLTLAFLKLAPTKFINTAHPEFLALFRGFFQTIVRAKTRHNRWPSKNWYSSYSSRYAAKIAKIFLENDAIIDDHWSEDIYWAIRQKEEIAIIQLLVDHISDDSVKREFVNNFFQAMLEYPCTDLSDSETRCYKQVLRDLMSKGAVIECDYINWFGDHGPMQLAVKARNIPAAEFLNEVGINYSLKGREGQSLLHLLAERQSKNQKMFDFLVNKGLDVNAKDKTGQTPLHSAARHENVALARKLIDLGADINCRTNGNMTPLHFAVINNNSIELAQLLLENGADVDAEDDRYQSPLIFAIFPYGITKAKVQMVRLLLNWGAQVKSLYAVVSFRGGNTWFRYERDYSYLFRDCEDNVKTLLNQHCLKLIAAGLLVTESCPSSLQVTMDNQYYQECLKELETLKCTFINSYTSLHQFIYMDLDRKSHYAKNEELKKLVDPPKLEKKFPRYSSVILAGYLTGKMRNSLLERAKDAWLELTEIDFPDVCIERVLFYLSNEELLKVIVEPEKKA